MRSVAKSLLWIGLTAGLAATGCGAHSSSHPTGGLSNEIFGIGSAPTGGHFRFLPAGETIAADQLRRGWRYRFIGELYEQGGRRYFYIVLQNPGRGPLGTHGAESLVPQGRSGPFAYGIEEGCSPRRWVILYGLLAGSGDSVTAKMAHVEYALKRIRIPTAVRPRGVFAYAALPGIPDSLTVRSANGRTVSNEALGGAGAGPCQPGSIQIAIAK
jgi:hypothetical protein